MSLEVDKTAFLIKLGGSMYSRESEAAQHPTLEKLIEIINESHSHFPIRTDGKSVLEIKFDEGDKPVRKVVKRSSYRQTYQLFSKKMGVEMSCESRIEFNGCYILETMPEIKSYRMQPATIHYTMNGEKRRHVPDALIEFNDCKKCFVEFKGSNALDDEELQLRTELLSKHLPVHGYGYLVICDDQVDGISLANAKILFHMEQTKVSEEVLMYIKDILNSRKKLAISELLKVFIKVPNMKSHLYQLIKKGIIGFDREFKLTNKTEVHWKGIVK